MYQEVKNFFKATCLFIAALAFSITPSFAQEQTTLFPEELSLTKVGGGGDASEMRVNEIRADLVDWIERGGAEGLELPYGLALEEYESRMLAVLRAQFVNLTFVAEDHPTNPELQVSVDRKPKTCRGFLAAATNVPQIICNIERFANTEEALQYRLIHHEYAGLAYVERNDGSASDYFISNQITDFLEETTVLRLAVKPAETKKTIQSAQCRVTVNSSANVEIIDALSSAGYEVFLAEVGEDPCLSVPEVTQYCAKSFKRQTKVLNTPIRDFFESLIGKGGWIEMRVIGLTLFGFDEANEDTLKLAEALSPIEYRQKINLVWHHASAAKAKGKELALKDLEERIIEGLPCSEIRNK